MKKLLLIDDKATVDVNNVEVYQADKWKEEKIRSYEDVVEVVKKPINHFNWDMAGNFCYPLFNVDDYGYIFIHHSQKGDSMMPSNIIDLMKNTFGEKLILFSGSINENFLNTDNKGFTFRSIPRDKLWKKLPEFLKKSHRLNEWVLEVLFYDIDDYLIKKILLMQDQDMTNEDIIGSKEFNQLMLLKCIDPNLPKYHQLIKFEGFDLVSQLRSL